MKISVITPIYNVEHFIAHCVETLMRQTLDEVEYIFVNDATPDDSMGVLNKTLEKFPEKLSQVRILTHAENKGLPAARNTGLEVATGKYIFHCDSDDFMEPDTLKMLYDTAEEQDADYVWCDYFIASKMIANIKNKENTQVKMKPYVVFYVVIWYTMCGTSWLEKICIKTMTSLFLLVMQWEKI